MISKFIKLFAGIAVGVFLLLAGSSFLPSAKQIPFSEPPPPLLTEKPEIDERLQQQTDSLLPFFEMMPPVPVFLKNEPVIKTGTNTERGVAYTVCEKNEYPVIYVKKIFYRNANQKQLVNILKHELTHAYFCRRGQIRGHDREFRRKFEEAGGFGN